MIFRFIVNYNILKENRELISENLILFQQHDRII